MDGYVTGANNELLSDGVYNYEYDNEGNLIRQTSIANGEVTIYEWDYLNRLVAVTDLDGVGNEIQTVEFTYDMYGRRLSKVVDGVGTYFVYDGDDVILDFVDDGNGVVLDKRYLHGTGVDQVLAQEDSLGFVTWHLTDHLGSIRDLVDNSGNVVNHFVYDSYGNVVSETNSNVDSRYRFTGREWDEEIDLYYYRARYYSGETGRFISVDPIGFDSGTHNLYGYVENSPINNSDPTGEASFRIRGGGIVEIECHKIPKSGIIFARWTVASYPDRIKQTDFLIEFSNGEKEFIRRSFSSNWEYVIGGVFTPTLQANINYVEISGRARGELHYKMIPYPPLRERCPGASFPPTSNCPNNPLSV